MPTITIPPELVSTFVVPERTRVTDADGNILGYYTPIREGTEADYAWARQQFNEEDLQKELKLHSGPNRTLAEILADLRARYGE
jgi:hypothetical protein